MRQPTHLITTSDALRRVFLSHLNDASIRTPSTLPNINRTPHSPQCLLPRLLTRQVTTFRPFDLLSPSSSLNPAHFGPKDNLSNPRPRDEEIAAHRVYMVNPLDQRLSEPRLLASILAARERDDKGRFTQFVQQVSPSSAERPYPVCKMLDRKKERENEEARRKAARTAKRMGKQSSKELDINWTVSDYDLGHRLERLREFLEKGWRVEVVFGSQRKAGWARRRQASLEEAQGVLDKIRNFVAQVEGAKEKGMQGEVGQATVLTFEGKVKK